MSAGGRGGKTGGPAESTGSEGSWAARESLSYGERKRKKRLLRLFELFILKPHINQKPCNEYECNIQIFILLNLEKQSIDFPILNFL
jgi:hypothetical protein